MGLYLLDRSRYLLAWHCPLAGATQFTYEPLDAVSVKAYPHVYMYPLDMKGLAQTRILALISLGVVSATEISYPVPFFQLRLR